MSISANFPNVRPSLLLDFSSSQQLDPRVTFSRSTTAPYYDGKTSVLAEQNLLLQSQNFATTWLISGLTATANNATAPDGTTTASLITLGAGTSQKFIYQSIAVLPNGITYSVYLKAGTQNYVQLCQNGSSSNYANFDLSLGTVGSFGTGITATITSVGSSWYRCSISHSNTNGALYYLLGLDSATTGYQPATSSTGTFYAWGAQLEQRSSVTAYNATTTSAITNYIPQLLTAPINAPRFDFNPTTGESLGLLIEQSSTNLLTYSSDFSNAAWTKTNATVTTTADIAPDGTQTFNLLQETTATGLHAISETYTKAASAITYTQSVYFKAKERTYSYIQVSDGSGNGAIVYFNLSTGVISTAVAGVGTAFTGLSATISLVGNNVYRCTLTSTSNTVTSFVAQFGSSTDGSTNSYTGNGYSGIYIWGAQLEALAFPTSYIPTTSAQATRASDNASMTGTNFSSWYNYPNGTFYTEYARSATGIQNSSIFCVQYDINNYVNFYGSGGNDFLYAASQGVSSVLNQSFGTTSTSYKKFAISLAALNVIATYNATTPYTNSTYPQPNSFTALGIGQAIYSAGTTFNGRIKKLAYYPQAVTSAQLQALTGS